SAMRWMGYGTSSPRLTPSAAPTCCSRHRRTPMSPGTRKQRSRRSTRRRAGRGCLPPARPAGRGASTWTAPSTRASSASPPTSWTASSARLTRKGLVGAARFELATTCTPCRYATRLRSAPRVGILPLQLLQDGAQLALDRSHIDPAAIAAAVAHWRLRLFLAIDRVVEAVARAADGEPFFVEQLADPPDQQHLVVLVVAAVAAALHR